MSAQTLLAEIILGLITGSTYVLVAVGFTLIYGVMRLINFAQLTIITIGAFIYIATYSVLQTTHFITPVAIYVVALLAAFIGTAVGGLILALGYWYPIRRAPNIALLVASLAALILLEDLIELFISPLPLSAPNPLTGGILTLAGVQITFSDAAMLVVGIGATWLVYLLVTRTRFGIALRAVADNSTSASLMGVPYTRIVLLTFAVAAGLAGLAGAMIAGQYGSVIYDMGIDPGLFGFTAAVLGGMGNIWGAVIGGLLLGVISSLSITILPSAWQEAVTFAVLILVLAFRPTGILPTRSVERA